MYTYIHDVANVLADRNEEQRAKRLATRGYLLTGTKVPKRAKRLATRGYLLTGTKVPIQTPEVPYYNL
jgi:hypothetical protein